MNKTSIQLMMVAATGILLSACTKPDVYGGEDQPKRVKVGKPYEVMGQSYVPKYEPEFVEQGLASWYGPGFHGRSTASGEQYDQNEMTAAHRTLPLPSIVKITLLKTGKSVKARVNDRGPFSKKRVIDVSEKTAKELGLKRYGVAEVKVEYLQEDTEQYLAKMGIPEPDWMKERRAVAGTDLQKSSSQSYASSTSSSPLPPTTQTASRSENHFSVVEYASQYQGGSSTKDDLPQSYVPSESVTPPDGAVAKPKAEKSFFSKLAFWQKEAPEQPVTDANGVVQQTYQSAELDNVGIADLPSPDPVHIEVTGVGSSARTSSRDEVAHAPTPSASISYTPVSATPTPPPAHQPMRRMVNDPALPSTLLATAEPTITTPFSAPNAIATATPPVASEASPRHAPLTEPVNLMSMDVLPPVKDTVVAPSASVGMSLPETKKTGYVPSAPIAVAPVAPPAPVATAPKQAVNGSVNAPSRSSVNGGYAVQTGAFSSRENAQKQINQIRSIASATIRESDIAGRRVYRVVVGQLASEQEAHALRSKLAVNGMGDARIVKE